MSSTLDERRPRGFVLIGVFFIFGATMAAYAAITLLYPGTFLDALWTLNKTGHMGLLALGRWGALPFVVLSPMLGLASVGWFRRRRWGWGLGVAIISINMAGDLSQVAFGERWKGVVGAAIAGMLLVYMTSRSMRNHFADGGRTADPSLRSG